MRDYVHAAGGFFGVLFLGVFLLLVIGFYRVEISKTPAVSAAPANSELSR